MQDLDPTNHSAIPEHALTIARAHRIMQNHRNCPVSICGAKAQAKRKLVETGKLIPADAPHVGS